MKTILELEPIKEFLDVVGNDIKSYFGKDDACIIYLRPDGIFYGEALYQWLRKKKQNVVIITMEDDGSDLDENKVRNRKVLIVDNDVVTGKGYKRAMEALRMRRKALGIKGIKFATSYDRVGVADFSVAKYSAEAIWRFEDLDAIDLKIIHYLSQNGRLSLADIGNKIHLSSVAVKNRLGRLLKEKIIRIEAALNLDQFYTVSTHIYVEADRKTVETLIEKFERRQEVFTLVRVSGMYNLLVGVAAHNWQNIEEFIESEVRAQTGVRKIFITTGEVPIAPKAVPPQF